MNDFERKLRDTPLRQPPAAWRAETLAALPANQPATLNWPAWLWPAPSAWAALAAVWLILFALDFATAPSATGRPVAAKPPPPDSLLAFHNEQALALLH